MYAQVMGGVSLDFALHVRKSPISLDEIQQQVCWDWIPGVGVVGWVHCPKQTAGEPARASMLGNCRTGCTHVALGAAILASDMQ